MNLMADDSNNNTDCTEVSAKNTDFHINTDGINNILERRWAILAILTLGLIVLLLVYSIIPVLDGIVLGVLFAFIARPIYSKIAGITKFAAIISTMCIVIPISIILGLGALEIANQIKWALTHQLEILTVLNNTIISLNLPDPIFDEFYKTMNNFGQALIGIIAQIPALDYTKKVFLLLINYIISIYVCYFLLADGESFVDTLKNMIPAKYSYTINKFITHLDSIISGVFLGNMYAALLVSIFSLIVFYAFDIPHIPAMVSFIFLASLIPIFAGSMVLVPLSIYKYYTEDAASAAFFLIVAAVVIYGPTDLLYRPYIVGKTSHTHPLLMMLAFIGGALVAGIAGFFLAPMLMGVVIAAYKTQKEINAE